MNNILPVAHHALKHVKHGHHRVTKPAFVLKNAFPAASVLTVMFGTQSSIAVSNRVNVKNFLATKQKSIKKESQNLPV